MQTTYYFVTQESLFHSTVMMRRHLIRLITGIPFFYQGDGRSSGDFLSLRVLLLLCQPVEFILTAWQIVLLVTQPLVVMKSPDCRSHGLQNFYARIRTHSSFFRHSISHLYSVISLIHGSTSRESSNAS